jgi:hypothetical protein
MYKFGQIILEIDNKTLLDLQDTLVTKLISLIKYVELNMLPTNAHRCLAGISFNKHYEVLGLNDDASQKTINETYNNLQQQWNPDNYENSDEKKKAEKKLKKIKDAYKLLYNIKCKSLVIFDRKSNKKFDINITNLNNQANLNKADIPLLQDETIDAASPTKVFHFGGYHNDIDKNGKKIGNPHLIMYFRKSDTYVPTGHGGKFGYLIYNITNDMRGDDNQKYLLSTETFRDEKYTLSGFGGSPDYIEQDDKYEQPEITVFREMMEELFGNLYRRKTIEDLTDTKKGIKVFIATIILSMCNIIRPDDNKYKFNINDNVVTEKYLVKFFEGLFGSYINKESDEEILKNIPAAFRKIIIKDDNIDFESIVFDHSTPSGIKVVSPTHYFLTNPVTFFRNQMTNDLFLNILRNSFEEKEVTAVFSVKLTDELKEFLNLMAQQKTLNELKSFMDDPKNTEMYNSLFTSCISGKGKRSKTTITLTKINYEVEKDKDEDKFILYGIDSTGATVVIFKIVFGKDGKKIVQQKKIISNYKMEHNIKVAKGNDFFYTLYYALNNLGDKINSLFSRAAARIDMPKPETLPPPLPPPLPAKMLEEEKPPPEEKKPPPEEKKPPPEEKKPPPEEEEDKFMTGGKRKSTKTKRYTKRRRQTKRRPTKRYTKRRRQTKRRPTKRYTKIKKK